MHDIPQDTGQLRARCAGWGSRGRRPSIRRGVELVVCALALCAAVETGAGAQKMTVRVERDRTFTFQGLRTWAWHPDGPGDVRMMSMSTDDPAPIKAMVEPMMLESTERALGTRGLKKVPVAGAADLLVNYYVLVMPATNATQLGQFLPPVTDYGLPIILGPVTPTTRLRAFEEGTLVLDVVSPKLKGVVWRGIARTEVHREYTPEQRRARIDRAVQEIVKRLPRK